MGRHAADERRRGIAPWAIMTVVGILLVGAVAVAYFLLNRKSSVADDQCTGSTTLQVVAAPAVAEAVRAAAAEFDATKPVARSTCVKTAVSPRAGDRTVSALAAGWEGQQDPAPAYWVADSAADLAELDAANSALTAGRSTTPVATSPVVLVTHGSPSPAIGSISWSGLPAAAGSARLVLADPGSDEAAQAAVLSVLGASGTVRADSAQTQAAALRSIVGSGAGRPADSAAALTTLAGKDAPFDATVAFEAQVAAANKATGGTLTAVYPSGPTAQAEVLTAAIKGAWVDPTASAAAALFDAYLSGTQGKKILADLGFRVPDTAPAVALTGVTLSQPVTVLTEPGPAVLAEIHKAVAALTDPAGPSSGPSSAVAPTPSVSGASPPVSTTPTTRTSVSSGVSTSPGTTTARTTPQTSTTPTPTTKPAQPGPVVTVIADTSDTMNQVVGGKSRNEWLQLTLRDLATKAPTADLGLWTVSTSDGDLGYKRRVPLGPLNGKIGSDLRSKVWTDTLAALRPSGDSWMYGAVQTGYAEASGQVVAGRSNVVIAVVSGADQTPSLSRSTLISTIRDAAGKGVILHIIGLSDEVNADAMTQIANAGGGSYQQITADRLPATLLALAK